MAGADLPASGAAPSAALAVLAVFVGSGAGGVLRFGVGLASRRLLASALAPPLPALAGTLLVNLAGSALLMALLTMADRRGGFASDAWRLLWTTGLMGGFTTYSTFNAELLALWSAGRLVAGAGYLLVTVGGCIAGGAVGVVAATALAAQGGR